MCGIVGFISNDTKENVINKMLSIQAYRGPNDSGVLIENLKDKFIHFGHNRLSIQDLSPLGHQPFVSDCGNYIIVYNGEVYNFKSIRKELEELRYKFISQSDTEVILYAYKEWGIECLDKFIGMFAFAILDKKLEKMFIVRDRAGVKPLYYYNDGKSFLFSSELKSFHEYPDFRKELNKAILPYYFQFGYIPAPHTIFKNCYKLEPGHYLELRIENLEFKIEKYWSIEACYQKKKFEKSEEEILAELEKLLIDASKLRMVSDVPVGVFLSGGYDSSLVTALLSKDKKRKLYTFTIGFDDKKYNEAQHAKLIAKHFNTKHTEYYVSAKEMLDKVEDLPFYYDEPFGDSSAIPTMIVSELAKKDVTVALSADGGDEAFCGYSKYFFLEKFAPIFSNPVKNSILNSALSIFDGKQIEWINELLPKSIRQTNIKDKYNKFKRAMRAKSLEEMFINASSYVNIQEVKSFLNIDIEDKLYKKFYTNEELSLIDKMMLVDYRTFMVDDVLTKVDRATMSVSLEGREPLLDHRIIEFMARVPDELKYKNQEGKYLARQILYKYIPRKIIDKPKAGFQIPLGKWLQNELKPLVDRYVNSASLDNAIFNVSKVEKIKKALFAGDTTNANAIWFILMFEMWRERWL